jgi:hypothetical protein
MNMSDKTPPAHVTTIHFDRSRGQSRVGIVVFTSWRQFDGVNIMWGRRRWCPSTLVWRWYPSIRVWGSFLHCRRVPSIAFNWWGIGSQDEFDFINFSTRANNGFLVFGLH